MQFICILYMHRRDDKHLSLKQKSTLTNIWSPNFMTSTQKVMLLWRPERVVIHNKEFSLFWPYSILSPHHNYNYHKLWFTQCVPLTQSAWIWVNDHNESGIFAWQTRQMVPGVETWICFYNVEKKIAHTNELEMERNSCFPIYTCWIQSKNSRQRFIDFLFEISTSRSGYVCAKAMTCIWIKFKTFQ